MCKCKYESGLIFILYSFSNAKVENRMHFTSYTNFSYLIHISNVTYEREKITIYLCLHDLLEFKYRLYS